MLFKAGFPCVERERITRLAASMAEGRLCATLLNLVRICRQKHPKVETKDLWIAWNEVVQAVFQGEKKPV